jgi:DNA processing protein
MDADLLYKIALTQVMQIGPVHARALLNIFGNAKAIFSEKETKLAKIDGIGPTRAKYLANFDGLTALEKELAFIEKYKIKAIDILNEAYPKRLLACYDSPTLLFYRGTANLNHTKILSIVGTRSNSDYGKKFTEQAIENLKDQHVIIVSGLAHGIDTIAHKSALKNNLETIGVLAHGLDRVYPSQNRATAAQMIEQGGLLTEFITDTNPDRQNFPKRNRIVAGMCDALLVVESSKKGGSMITAELATSYNKKLFTIPGKLYDKNLDGNNYLIKAGKATMLTNAAEITEQLQWGAKGKPKKAKQQQLFLNLTANEQKIMDLFANETPVAIDTIYLQTGLDSGAVAEALLMLEMQGAIISKPGKLFERA